MMLIGHRKRIFASLRRGREEDSQHDVIDHLPTATGVSSFPHWLIAFNRILLHRDLNRLQLNSTFYCFQND